MKKSYLLWSVVALAVALATLTGCGSSNESDSASKGESSTPSAPTATPLPPTVTPVPDNLTGDQLRLLIVAAADTVKSATWDMRSGQAGNTLTWTTTKLYSMMSYRVGSVSMASLHPDDRMDDLATVNGKEYMRVNNGPWTYDADRVATPLSAPSPFPEWLSLIRPVGDQETNSYSTGTSTNTVTDLKAAPAPSTGSNRCWSLTVTLAWKSALSGSPEREGTTQHIYTACEPSFLVSTHTIHPINAPSGVTDTVEDNYRYNTGDVPDVPTQAVEVHCKAFGRNSPGWFTCMFQ